MIASQFRLKKKHNIEYIVQCGKYFHNTLFLAKYVPNRIQNYRFSVITSQKFAKEAVKRNRVRRQIYEAIRLLLPKIPLANSTHYDCIIIPKKSIFKTDFQKITREITFFLKSLQ